MCRLALFGKLTLKPWQTATHRHRHALALYYWRIRNEFGYRSEPFLTRRHNKIDFRWNGSLRPIKIFFLPFSLRFSFQVSMHFGRWTQTIEFPKFFMNKTENDVEREGEKIKFYCCDCRANRHNDIVSAYFKLRCRLFFIRFWLRRPNRANWMVLPADRFGRWTLYSSERECLFP